MRKKLADDRRFIGLSKYKKNASQFPQLSGVSETSALGNKLTSKSYHTKTVNEKSKSRNESRKKGRMRSNDLTLNSKSFFSPFWLTEVFRGL